MLDLQTAVSERGTRLVYILVILVIVAIVGGLSLTVVSSLADLRADERSTSARIDKLEKDLAQYRTENQLLQAETRQSLGALSSTLALVQGLVTKPAELKDRRQK